MAATIARAIGSDRTRSKCVHKLGSIDSQGEANTFLTFSRCFIRANGSGYIEVTRGLRNFRFNFGTESEELEVTPGVANTHTGG